MGEEGGRHARHLEPAPPRDSPSIELDLPKGRAWSAPAPRGGLDVECESGALWITVEGDPEDHVVKAPDHFSTAAHRRVAALALESSHLAVKKAASA